MYIKINQTLPVLTIILVLLITSCDNNIKEIPKTVSDCDLSVFKTMEYQGNLDSETVIIYCQGGPETTLTHNELPYEFVKSAPIKKLQNSLIVYAHQIQTLKPSLITEKEISFEQAKEYDKETTKILTDIVKYFTNKGQKVYLVGTSFGAFVVQDYIAINGSGLLNGAVICVGRLDLPEEFWKPFSEGKEYYFKNGITPIERKDIDRKMDGNTQITSLNIPKMASGLGFKRYTEILKNKDLSNVFYIYGEIDEDVGRLSDSEIDFLEEKKVKILKSKSGHQEASIEFLGKAIMDMVSK